MKVKYIPKTNRQILALWFKDEDIDEALALIRNGTDTEPYLSNRLLRIMWLLRPEIDARVNDLAALNSKAKND